MKHLLEQLFNQKSFNLSKDSKLISYDSKIIYEYDEEMVQDNDPEDRAEIAMNAKRLTKSFEELNLPNPAFLHYQGVTNSQSECVIIVQVMQEKDLEST